MVYLIFSILLLSGAARGDEGCRNLASLRAPEDLTDLELATTLERAGDNVRAIIACPDKEWQRQRIGEAVSALKVLITAGESAAGKPRIAGRKPAPEKFVVSHRVTPRDLEATQPDRYPIELDFELATCQANLASGLAYLIKSNGTKAGPKDIARAEETVRKYRAQYEAYKKKLRWRITEK